jgi:outer membrane murein-binding lipoprotein Lpp
MQMRTKEHSSRLVVSAVVLGCALLLAGCASEPEPVTPSEMPPQTQPGLTELRNQMLGGKAQIQRTTDAARDLVQRPLAQIEPQIESLAREVQALEGLATRAGTQYEAQKGRTQTYFETWTAELETMSKEVREAGMQRHEESLASLTALESRVERLRGTFRPYMEALTESAQYLRTDPTPSGVKSITPRMQQALDVEKTLMNEIDAVIAQIDVMRGAR